MAKVEIYYFSGTGNSLYAARNLQRRISGSVLIPIVSLLGKERIASEAETVGIIFPLMGPTFPSAVKRFLIKIDLSRTEYIFAVATRGGTTCRIRQEMDKLLKRQGKILNAHFVITVFSNDPKFKTSGKSLDCHILTKEEIAKKEEEINLKLDEIQKIIINRETSHKKDTEYLFKYGFFLERIFLFINKILATKNIKDYFYCDSKCTGCGICERVCLSNRISIIEGRPVWNEKVLCFLCYACINYCPAESIQIRSMWLMKSYTETECRYMHPFADAKDIENQKVS
jgi:ferredoxin